MAPQFHSWAFTQGLKSRDSKRHLCTSVHGSTIHNGQSVGATRVSTSGWTNTRVPPHTGRHTATERREDPTLATTSMDPETTMLSERSQTQKDPRCVIPLMGNVQDRPIHRHRVGV